MVRKSYIIEKKSVFLPKNIKQSGPAKHPDMSLKKQTSTLIIALLIATAGCTNEETNAVKNQPVATAKTSNSEKDSAKIKLLQTFSGFSKIDEVIITPDGQRAIGASDNVNIWNIATGQLLQSLEINTNIDSLAIHPNGKMLAIGRWDGTIELWDIIVGKRLAAISGHTMDINALIFTPDGKSLISGSEDGFLFIWDLTAGKLDRTLIDKTQNRQYLSSINAATLSEDGNTLVSTDDNSIKIWDYQTGKIERTIKDSEKFQKGIKSIDISSDGKTLAGATPDLLLVWDLDSENETNIDIKNTLDYKPTSITSIAINPNGKTLATGFPNGKIALWDLQTKQPILKEIQHSIDPTAAVQTLAYNTNGTLLISGSADGIIKIWQIKPF